MGRPLVDRRGALRQAAWLALDVVVLGCAAAALAELSLNLLLLRLGLISPAQVLSPWLLGLTAAGAVLVLLSRLRGIRAWLHEREDRRILATAGTTLLLAGYLSVLFAVAAIGEHERRSVQRDVRRSAAAMGELVDEAISERARQARLYAAELRPSLLRSGGNDAAHVAGLAASALLGLGAHPWALVGSDGRVRASAGYLPA